MDNQILNSYSKISNLNVSRETCNGFESFISMIQDKNKEINLISKKTSQKNDIRHRHIIDSAQIIDFVDLNSNTTSDLGTGGGMPGLIIALDVSEGDKIEEGQPLCTIEAMKMENNLRSERKGVVKLINKSVGDTIAVNDIIMEFE